MTSTRRITRGTSCWHLDKQQQRENSRRNYQNFQICYENARKLYDKQKGYGDEEMDFLGQMDEDLRKGGWY